MAGGACSPAGMGNARGQLWEQPGSRRWQVRPVVGTLVLTLPRSLLPSLVAQRSVPFPKTKQAKRSSGSSFSHPLGLISMGIQEQGWVTCMLVVHGAQLFPETPVPPAAHPAGPGHSLGPTAPNTTRSAPGSATRSHYKFSVTKAVTYPCEVTRGEVSLEQILAPALPASRLRHGPQHCTTTCPTLFLLLSLPVSNDSSFSRSAERCSEPEELFS